MTDWKKGVISNRLILIGLFLGLFYQVYQNSYLGLGIFFINISIPVILFYLLFLMHALGAGDIKLLSMTGSFFTIADSVRLMAVIFVVAAAFSLGKMVYNRILFQRVVVFVKYVTDCFSKGCLQPYETKRSWEYQIHFSTAVFAGTVIYLGVNICRRF